MATTTIREKNEHLAITDERADALEKLWHASPRLRPLVDIDRPGFGRCTVIRFSEGDVFDIHEILQAGIALGLNLNVLRDQITYHSASKGSQ